MSKYLNIAGMSLKWECRIKNWNQQQAAILPKQCFNFWGDLFLNNFKTGLKKWKIQQ